VEQDSGFLLQGARLDQFAGWRAETELALQRPGAGLTAAFEELSLDTVLAHIMAEPLAVPAALTVLELPETDVRRQHQRLLDAHEALAGLSDENRTKFAPVVEALRADAPGE